MQGTIKDRMSHTKGTWEVYTGHDGQFQHAPLIICPNSSRYPHTAIAGILHTGKDNETQANARLIAAAPEMYEALLQTIHVIALFDELIHNGTRDGDAVDIIGGSFANPIWNKAKAKAEGGDK